MSDAPDAREDDAPLSALAGLEPPEPPAPVVATPARKQPLWTYFLTPIAVVIGSGIIASAVWITSDSGGEAKPAAEAATAGVAISPAAMADTAAAPANMLAALTSYAKQLGLDQQKFTACLGKNDNLALINKHLQRGTQLGVNGTPTFFINNKKIVGAQPAAVFDEIIAAELSGSPTTLDGYSDAIKQRAASSPPGFEIVQGKVDVSDATIEGNPNAKVMIAEFSDFQCPFCKSWFDTYIKRLRSQLGNDVAFAFLHFPISQIHPNAGNASMAAICAGEQDKFAPMHDLLFQRQNDWAKLPAN